ncbi:hypothetical protein BRARA_D00392 [Brassica rapa]|uniref:Uncharacterized protein n=1 Tax=Brassica campestris TaxID=3711 RepID=A0A397ZQ29_BRACM|nr:hypothetical protein BRARA_D00392 [Brassica rapa]
MIYRFDFKKRNGRREAEDEEEKMIEQPHKKRCLEENPQDIIIDAVFDKDEGAALDGGDSDSDGYLDEFFIYLFVFLASFDSSKQEAVEKIHSGHFTNCLDLWDCDIQPLVYTIIQIINGVATLFIGPRYLLLRVKCIQWLNRLSRASGIFIRIASLVATIPIMRLKKFNERSTIEGLKRVVKRFTEQVEMNIEYVQMKRDEAAFSPNDQQSIETFLLVEKRDKTSPYTQYYESIIDKAIGTKQTKREFRWPK